MTTIAPAVDLTPGYAPRVLIFDVNETLLDIESLTPHFEGIFGDPLALRTWFGELVMYSMTLTLSSYYVDFFTLGRAVLHMLAETRGVDVADSDESGLEEAMRTMPAHPDVAVGLQRLLSHGYRLVTLTNSPHPTNAPSPLDNSGLAALFEHQFTVNDSKQFKPATLLYRRAAADLDLETEECMMVAAHTWDLIGARSAGMRTALITRPGNAPLVAAGIPQPDVLVADVVELADRLTSKGR